MAAENYPKTILEFASKFYSDEVCFKYLIESRWPKGFKCPSCKNKGGWWIEKYHRFECTKCHKQVSPLVGTLMQSTHLPLRYWFWAAYLVATHTPGISALQMQRQLGIKKIDTAWYLLHRLRHGMIREGREKLQGTIEVLCTHDFPSENGEVELLKPAIIGAIEILEYKNKKGVTQTKAGKLRLQKITKLSKSEVDKFIKKNVKRGSELIFFDATDFKNINSKFKKTENAKAVHIHRVFSNLNTWIKGTYHGVDPKYLQTYLDEFVFRFNRRHNPMSAFRSLLGIISEKKPIPLKKLKNLSEMEKH